MELQKISRENMPAINQVVLVQRYKDDPCFTLAYVIKNKKQIRFTQAITSEFNAETATSSLVLDGVTHWAQLPYLSGSSIVPAI